MRTLWIWMLLCLPTLGWGANSYPLSIKNIDLNPQSTDVSIAYLSNIFGVVNGILHGGGSQILGEMFGIFNSILFCFAGVLWAYTSFIGILNTASEGQFLGQRWSSMWIPFRIVSGACLLFPNKATGYSLIQVMVMYIVVQGVGAANLIWNTTLNYLYNSGTIIEFSQPLKKLSAKQAANRINGVQTIDQDNSFLVEVVGDILKAEVAMLTLNRAMERQTSKLGLSYLPSFTHTLTPQPDKDEWVIQFPGPVVGGPYQDEMQRVAGQCGQLRWKKINQGRLPNNPKMDNDRMSFAINRTVQILLPVAQQIADQILLSTTTQSDSTAQPNSFPVGVSIRPSPLLPPEGILVNAASDLLTLIKSEISEQRRQVGRSFQQKLTDMQQEGWILAGSYYYQLAELNKELRRVDEYPTLVRDKLNMQFRGNDSVLIEKLGDEQTQRDFRTYLNSLNNYIEKERDLAENPANSKFYPKFGQLFPMQSINVNTEDPASISQVAENYVLEPIQKNIQAFQQFMESMMHKHLDPMMALARIGNALLHTVEGTWKDIAHKGKSLESLMIKENNLLFLAPLLFLWVPLNFTVGATLIYYIPLIPFLLFFFGSLTWLAFVVEAMVAAPLIALGITHPEGHDFFGKAEQATMLLASIFLRPMLMIFGFILGMILCTVSFNLFHYGYSIAIQAIQQVEGQGRIDMVTHTAMMIVYTTAAVTVVTRSFAMIYEIPNRALRWIGGPADGHSESEGLMQIKGGIDRYAEGANSNMLRKKANDF